MVLPSSLLKANSIVIAQQQQQEIWFIAETRISMAMAASTHILVIPYPAQGHMTPILDLTAQLFLRGLTRITILVTPNNLQSLTPILANHPSIETLVLPFPPHPQIPPGVENIKHLGNASNPAMITALSALQQPVTEWFNTHRSPPTAIISDFFLGHLSHQLAQQFHVPHLAFFSSGAFLACIVSHLFTDMDVMDHDKDEDGVQHRQWVKFTNLPNSPVFEWGELPSIYRLYKTSPIGGVFRDAWVANLSSCGCIFNSFQYLEGEYLDHVAKLLTTPNGRVFGVGPLNLLGVGLSNRSSSMEEGTSSEENKRLSNWLDSSPDGSVLYVSFGSQKWLTHPQTQSLAHALDQSGTRFLWVARSGPNNTQLHLPNGFETRVTDRGFIVKESWVDQVTILNHKAVGRFLTHCGWNSLLEGLTAGVIILAWPMEADQFVNAKLLVDDLGVAVRVCEGAETVPGVEEIAKVVKQCMTMEEGDVLRDRWRKVRELKAKGVETVMEGGSSIKNLDELVNQLKRMDMQK